MSADKYVVMENPRSLTADSFFAKLDERNHGQLETIFGCRNSLEALLQFRARFASAGAKFLSARHDSIARFGTDEGESWAEVCASAIGLDGV